MKNKLLVILVVILLTIIAIALGLGLSLGKKETQPSSPPPDELEEIIDKSREPLAPIAKRLPDFGGFFIEGDVAYVYLLDTSRLPEAENIIKKELGGDHPRILQAEFRALKADYSFLQLIVWKEKIRGEIKTDLLDLDESENKIRIGIVDLDSPKENEIRQKLNNLGVPLPAVIIKKTEPVMPL